MIRKRTRTRTDCAKLPHLWKSTSKCWRTCSEFVLSKMALKKTSSGNALMAVLGAVRSATPRDQEFAHRASLRITSKLKQQSISDILGPEDLLCGIRDRAAMKAWLVKYKLKDDLLPSWCQAEYVHGAVDGQLDLTHPMGTWVWHNVVAFVKHHDELKHLTSVFWQYRIEGRELCKVGRLQMELLVECSLLKNHRIDSWTASSGAYSCLRAAPTAGS